jgi:hypothetical protein
MKPTPTPIPLRIAARMARAGACAEMWLIETGHPRDIWAEIDLEFGPDDVVHLVPRHGEESALELVDTLGAAGTRRRHGVGPITLAMPESITVGDPWAGPQRATPLPLPWIATIVAAAAKTVLEDIGAQRRLRREMLPLVWLARAAAATLDRRARLRAAPRVADPAPRRNVVNLH